MKRKLLSGLTALVLLFGLTALPVAAEGEENGGTAPVYVARIDDNQYETLAAAITSAGSGDTVTLLSDASGDGIIINSAQLDGLIIDFSGYTYTVNGSTVGSARTETQCFQILTGGSITMKNGSIVADTTDAQMLIQNYSNLTLEGMTLDATKGNNTVGYVVSNNCGNTVISNTAITAKSNGVAFDVYGGFGSYGDVTVTVTGSSVIDGTVEVDRGNSNNNKNTLKIEEGIFKGNIDVKNSSSDNTSVSISGGTFATDVSNYVVAGNTAIDNGDGTYSIGVDTSEDSEAVAEVNGYGYTTVQAAVNAIDANGGTVTMLKNATETVTIQVGTTVTLDLNGKTITTSGSTVNNNGTLTVKDSSEPSTGKLVSTGNYCIVAGSNSTTTFVSGTIESVEGAIITGTSTGATINIIGGMLMASDNAVVAGNGTSREGEPNTINISGGTLKGGITTSGYVACGVYAPWKDNINITGGTIDVVGGAGVVARAGNVSISGGTITTTGSATGKVGDSRVVVPCSAIVYDSETNYPAMTGDSKIIVTGGMFKSDSSENAIANVGGDIRLTVSGGLFSSPVPADYCAEGYNPTGVYIDGYYTVCNHYGAVAVAAKAATCVDDGNIAYWYCEACGRYFSDAEYKKEITLADTVIPATGEHTSDGGVVTTEATTGHDGVRTYSCTVCGKVLKTETIPQISEHPEIAAAIADGTWGKAEATPAPTAKPAEAAAKPTTTTIPQTGDASNPALPAVVMIAALLGLCGTALARRRGSR